MRPESLPSSPDSSRKTCRKKNKSASAIGGRAQGKRQNRLLLRGVFLCGKQRGELLLQGGNPLALLLEFVNLALLVVNLLLLRFDSLDEYRHDIDIGDGLIAVFI